MIPRPSTSLLAAAVAVPLVSTTVATLISRRTAPASTTAAACDAPNLATPSPDLYCLDLVPVPDLPTASGRVGLDRVASPFGIAASPEGHLIYDAAILLEGLPDPATLGAFTTYVAWVTTPILRPMIKLGAVANGRNDVGPIGLNKFLILISAEPHANVAERSGRLVLRGTSPSFRLLPDNHLMVATGSPDNADRPGVWPMPPMHPRVSMPPGLSGLRPGVTPFLPGENAPAVVPDAVPRRVVRLTDGDTLSLEAGYVRRTIRERSFLMYGFNGQYPGPLIDVTQDATIIVDFTNRIDLPTAVHWHGLRHENAFDGVPGVTQDAVPPGGRFRYRVTFPDAGVYWYHPHHREDIQQDLGLYGNMVVRSPDPGYLDPVNREAVWMLDDLLVGAEGLIPYGREAATHALMGRFGNLLLVNGEPDLRLDVRRGEVVRFFLTNVSNTRTFNVVFGGAPMKVIGSDIGKYEREQWVESVVMAPAERYVVDVRFATAGEVAVTNRVQGLDHLFGRFFAEIDTLATVTVGDFPAVPDHEATFTRLRDHPDVIGDIDRYRHHFTRPVDRELVLSLETEGLPFPIVQQMQRDSTYFQPVEWSGTMPMMNWVSTGREVRWILRDPATGRENLDIDWRFATGDVVKIRLINDRNVFHAMQHPIHFHGLRLLVLEQNDVRNDNLVWKDTLVLPVGSTAIVLLDVSNPGRWMVHCHIAEHLEAGMKMVLDVIDEP